MDPNATRLLLTAEMLKPSSPCYESASAATSSSGTAAATEEIGPIVEHLPEMVVLHNRARLEDFSGDRIQRMARLREIATYILGMLRLLH